MPASSPTSTAAGSWARRWFRLPRKGLRGPPLGEILKNPALEAVRFTARSAPKLMHRGRNVSRSLIGPILRAASYSDLQVSRSLDAFSQRMMNGTPIPTTVGFLEALEKHDETGGLWTLLRVPTHQR